jgi:hypothetical protein
MHLERRTEDAIPNKLGWEYQFPDIFKRIYCDMKRYDENNILQFERYGFNAKFIKLYNENYDNIAKVLDIPDRHKVIALLTKTFLDMCPVYSDINKAQMLHDNTKRFVIFPNEFIAIKICEIVLNMHGKYNRKDQNYRFMFPNNIYIFSGKKLKRDFDSELFFLYRHYINTKKEGMGQFSIYQMACLYFTLEMSCDIAKYGYSSTYYS